MFYVYIIRSLKNSKFYIGYTKDLKKRVKEHNMGRNLATKPYFPYELIYYEALSNRKDALNREKYLKSGWGWRSIKKILKNYLKYRR